MPAPGIPPSGEELVWWRDAVSALGGALAAVACWSFLAGRKTREIEQRIEALEAMSARIDCLDKLIKGLERTLSNAALQRSEQNGEIRTAVAVTQALVSEMKEDISAIFDRLDRRQSNVYPPPHGERREQ